METYRFDELEFHSKAYTSLWLIQNKLHVGDLVDFLEKAKIPEIGYVMKNPHVYLLRDQRSVDTKGLEQMLANGYFKANKVKRVSDIDARSPYAVVCFLKPSGRHGECHLSSKDRSLLDKSKQVLLSNELVYVVCESRYSVIYDIHDLDILSKEIQTRLQGDDPINRVFGKLFLSNDKQIPVRIGICLNFSIQHHLKQIYEKTKSFINSVDGMSSFLSENKDKHVTKWKQYFVQCRTTVELKRRLNTVVQHLCQHLLESVDNIVIEPLLPVNIQTMLKFRLKSKLPNFVAKSYKISFKERPLLKMKLRSKAAIKQRRGVSRNMLNAQKSRTRNGEKGPTLWYTTKQMLNSSKKISSTHTWMETNSNKLAQHLYIECVNFINTFVNTLKNNLVILKDRLSDELPKAKESLILHELKTVSERNAKVKGFGFVDGTICIYLKTSDKSDSTEVSNYMKKYIPHTKYPIDIKYRQLSITPFSRLEQGSKVVPANAREKYGTLGMFLEDNKGAYFFTTCAHVIGRSESAYSADDNSKLGDSIFVCDSNFSTDDKIDFSLIQVSPEKNLTITFGLKASSGDFIKGEVFRGDILEICPCSVYKWGATEPHIQRGKCLSFESIGQLLLLNIDNKEFAKSGDSGSIVCIGDDINVGLAAFVLIGTETDKVTKKTTYAVYKVSDALEKVSDIRRDIKPCLKPDVKIIRIPAISGVSQTRKRPYRVLEPRP